MHRQTLLIGFLMVMLIATGCATTTPYNPFKVSQEEFCSKTKTIAMAPLLTPKGLENPEPVKVKFESLLEAKLREAGYTVIPSKEGDEIWRRMREQVGGFFDPVTGMRDESKYKEVQEHTRRELCTKFNADAILYPSIGVYTVSWSGWTANWHGTSEGVKSTGTVVLEALVGVSSSGTVPALSLTINIEDSNGVPAYINAGGIQLLSKISGLNKFVPVPREQLFVNEERNVKAVNFALDPLIKKTKPPGTAP